MKRLRWVRFGIEFARGHKRKLVLHFWRWTWVFG